MQRPFRMQATPQDPRQQHSNPTVRTHFNPRLTVRIPRIVSIPQRAIPRKPCDLQTQYRSQAEKSIGNEKQTTVSCGDRK